MTTLGSTRIASSYYQVKVGGDAAALKGIMKALIALDDAEGPGSCVLDHEFIVAHTHGFEAFATDLRGTDWSAIEATSGLSRDSLQAVAVAYSKSSATILSYGMGITQHSKGTSNVRQIANLLLLRGNFGRRDVLFVNEADLVIRKLEHGDVAEDDFAVAHQRDRRRRWPVTREIRPRTLRGIRVLAGEDRLVQTAAGWKIKYRTAYRHLTTTPAR